MARKRTAIDMLGDLANMSKDIIVSNDKGKSRSDRQAARSRLNRTRAEYYASARRQHQQQKKTRPKPKPKKKELSVFEKFIAAAKKRIMSAQDKTSSMYKNPGIQAAQHPTGIHNHYQTAVEKQKAYRAALQKKSEKEKAEAKKKEAASIKKDTLAPYEQLKKNGVLSPAAYAKINAEEKAVRKNFGKAYKKQMADDASEDLNRRLIRIGAKGLPAQHEEHKKITKEIKKKAAAYEKENQRKVLSTDEAMKSMAMARNSANNTKVNGKNYDKKYFSDELREQIRANIQSDYDKGSVGTGFMSGSMPVGDLKKAIERTYGIKLDDTRARQKLGFNVAEMAGYLAKSYAFGGATEETIAKALTKVITKKTGKQAVGKAGKFAANRAAEAIAATPVNLEDAARNSKDSKDFAKNVAINAGLDAGLGSVIDGVGAVGKAAKKSQTKKIMTKLATGEAMTKSEQEALRKTASKVVAKQISKRELTATEKIVEKNMDKVKSALKRKPYNKLSEVNPATKVNGMIQGRKDDKAFSDQVDNYLNGKLNPETVLKIGKTPRKLQKYGADDIEMTMKQGTVKKSAYPSGYMDALRGINREQTGHKGQSKGHNLGIGTVKATRKDLENPVAILKSDTQDNSFVVFTKRVDGDGRPIMAAVHLDKHGRVDVSNEVASIYSKDGYANFVEMQRKKGNVLYEDEKIGLEELPDHGLQLPGWGDKSDPINTLYQNGDKVNNKEALRTTNIPPKASTPVSTSDNAFANASIDNIPENSQNINIEEPKVGDKIDNAVIEAASKKDSEAIIDLENDPAVRDIVAGPKNKEKSSGSLKQNLVKMKDEFRQLVVDSLQGIEVIAKKVGGEAGERLNHQANALRQAGEKANYSITTKQTDFNMQVIGKGGIEILAPIMKRGKDTYSDFNAYLFHRLNIDRFKNGKSLWGEDVIPQEKSRQIISQLDDKYGDFSEAAEEVYQYFRNLNTVRVQSGMISAETKDMLEELYENYVPAYRNINKSALEKTVDGSMKVNTGIRRAKGGDQAILPIEKQMAYATQQAWKAAELNQTIKTLAEVQGHEIKEITEKILKDGDVTEGSLDELLSHSVFFEDKKTGLHKAVYYVDGKAYETKIDDIVYRGLSNWKPSDTWKMLDNDIFKAGDKVLTKWSNVHKALITTYNGFFALRNGVRDLGDALWYAKSGTDFVKNMPGAVKSIEKRDAYWQLWKASGGKYSGLLDITRALKPESTLKKIGKLRWIEAVNDAIEQYPRFVEFKSVLRKEMESAGITDPAKCTKEMIDKASHAGADITCNFGRVGSLTKPLNRTAVPFLNASIQGADKLWRVISGQKGVRGYINLLTKLTAIGVAPGVAMEIMYANDPSFQDLNARDKDNYIFIKDDAGAFWAIPRPRGASVIATPFQQLARQGLGNGEFSFDEFKQKLMNDLAPVSPFDANIFSQMINTYNNQTWYGGNIESYADAEAQKIERYNAKTTSFGKKASESMYKLLEKYGGKEIAEKYTLSPKKIDYLMDSYTGIIGDIGKSVTVMGSTKAWYHQLFDQNMKKDPVYSNHLSQDYYDKSDDLNKYCNDDGSPKKGAAIEQSARGQIFKNNNIALSNLRELQNSIRMNKDMSRAEKAKYDKELQIQINSIYRNGVNEKDIKVYDDFIKKHKDQYMSNEKLIKAAQQAYEKETHATVSAMDTIYKIGGLDEVIKHSSSYEDKSGDKNKLTYSKEKTIKQILKKYRKNGGKDDDFYSVYKEMTQANKERGIGTNSAYGNLAAITIRTSGKNPKTKGTLRDAFGVSEESRQIVNEYFKLGGSKKEYLAAAEAAEATSNSVRPKNGNKYNYFAPFKARGIADRSLPDRAYRVVDSAESDRRTEYYINNSRGLKHYNISAKTLQEIDNKSAKNEKGYSTSEGLQKVLDKTKYNREEKALIWEALYGYSYSTVNPYGAIGDYSLKSDVGIDTSGGYKSYGYRGYRRYSRGHGGRRGSGSSTEERSEFEKYIESLMNGQKSGSGIDEARMNYGNRRLNTKQYTSDQYRKAVARVLAKRLKA